MKIGLAGTPVSAPYTNWDVFYAWIISDLGRLKTAPLHKLKRLRDGDTAHSHVHASWDAVDYIVERMMGDAVGQQAGERVLQLLNEPMNSHESDWADDPREAATWVARTILSVRARCPWVRFAGPNVCPWETPPANAWVLEFLDELALRRAPLDIYAVHGYPLLWNEEGFLDHLEAVSDNASPLALIPEHTVWITEIGDLWGSTVGQVRSWMQQIEGFLERNAEWHGIDACLWFVTRDSYWHGLSPNTEIYDSEWHLTPTGQTWFMVWQRMGGG